MGNVAMLDYIISQNDRLAIVDIVIASGPLKNPSFSLRTSASLEGALYDSLNLVGSGSLATQASSINEILSITVSGSAIGTYDVGDSLLRIQLDVLSLGMIRVNGISGSINGEYFSNSSSKGLELIEPSDAVTVSGLASEGNELTAITNDVGRSVLSYQWLRDGNPITGANSSTYTLSDDDIGERISVRITYTDGWGTLETFTSTETDAIANVNDNPTGAVTISGTPTEGNELTAITSTIADADGLGAFSYQWLRDGNPITGANGRTYSLTEDDIGNPISVRITYTDGWGTTETLTSAQTAAVTAIVPETIVPETIVLTNTSDNYTGTNLPEIISTQGGDDVVIASKGNDTIDGGDGTDRVSYDGDQDAYTVTLGPSGIQVRDRRADGNGTDTLTNIEFLEFDTDDFANFNLDQFGGATSLNEADFKRFIELYIAYFNRAPDAIGLNFWGTAYANGTTMEQMAKLFAPQPETLNTYPEGTSNTDFATAVYNNVLGRTPDQAGFDFWVGVLDAGGVTRDQFILEVLRGVQDGSPDREYLDNKVDVGAYFAVHKGMSDTGNAAAAMQLYDGTEASIQTVKQAIDAYHLEALDPVSGEFLLPLVGVLDDPFV